MMQDNIYSNKKGEISIDYNKGFYYYLRLFYAAHGNTKEARVLLRKIKYIISKQESQLINRMFNTVDHLYHKCGNKTYDGLMTAIQFNINRLKPRGKELFKPHNARMINRVKKLTKINRS